MTVAKKAEDIVDEAAFQMEIAALATLDELAYRRIRKAKARAFELTLTDLDKLVEKERRKAKQKENKNKNPLVQRGFISDETGLSWRDPFNDGPYHHLAGPLNTRATTRDAHNNRWGLLIDWQDQDGHTHTWPMPRSALAGDPSDVFRVLLDGGLFIAPSRKDRERLVEYFTLCDPSVRARCVDRAGWYSENDGPRYVLPGGAVIGTITGEEVILQTGSPLNKLDVVGDLEGWKRTVAARCTGNSRALAAASASFVGPLLGPIGEESFGIHFEGPSSIGKTTLGRIATSTWGTQVYSWRTTDNSAESWCAAANDGLLMLDEISQGEGRVVDALAYMLAGGAGKGRANRNGIARPVARWRVFFISTGEVGLAEKLAEAGLRVRAGQLVRLIELPADAGAGWGVFENLHGFDNGAALADELKQATAQHTGHAGPTFVAGIVDRLPEIVSAIGNARNKWLEENLPARADGQVRRAAAKLGLIAAAGELAATILDLPWPKDAASSAAATCLKEWLEKRGGSGAHEVVAGIAQVRRFIEQHGELRFSHIPGSNNELAGTHGTINRAGWRRRSDPADPRSGWEYLILPGAWKSELCAGFNASTVARSLADNGLLLGDAGGKTSTTVTIPGQSKKIRVYRLSSDIIADQRGNEATKKGDGNA